MKFYPETIINNQYLSGLKRSTHTKKYVLLQKTPKKLLKNNTDFICGVPANADSFEILAIGKTDNKDYKKYITTFYSKSGEMIRKYIQSSDAPEVIRDYDTVEGIINGAKSRVRDIHINKYDPESYTYKLSEVHQHKSYSLDKKKIQLQINKNLINGKNIYSSVTEYPITGTKTDRTKRKILSVSMELKDDIPYITSMEGKNVNIPQNDKYLPFRMIFDKSLKKVAFARYLLNEKGLSQLNIPIFNSNKLPKNIAAYFSELNNYIMFNTEAKNDLIEVAAHEVQHAYQFSLIGRLGKSFSYFGLKCLKLLGQITNPLEKNRAYNYFVASEKYPIIENLEFIQNNPAYKNNYLEYDANREAQKIVKDYNEQGEYLGKQFIFGNI